MCCRHISASVLLPVVTAIDIWSVGIILLFFLTEKFPLFQSNDDIEALMEIAAILGRKRMEKAAILHSTNHSHLSVFNLDACV